VQTPSGRNTSLGVSSLLEAAAENNNLTFIPNQMASPNMLNRKIVILDKNRSATTDLESTEPTTATHNKGLKKRL